MAMPGSDCVKSQSSWRGVVRALDELDQAGRNFGPNATRAARLWIPYLASFPISQFAHEPQH